MRLFNGLKVYAEAWASNQARRAERARRQAAVKACPLCNEAGMLELKRQGTSEDLAHPCPHHAEHVAKIEERLNAHRVQPRRVGALIRESGGSDPNFLR